MDRITNSLLSEFVEQNELKALPNDQAFEHFCCYLAVGSHYMESLSTYDVTVGAGSDTGIDGIAIIVNGALVTEPEEVEDLEEVNGYLDVSFVFVQAERSSNFDSAKIGQFAFGVLDFLKEKPQLPQNDSVAAYSRIAKVIFGKSRLFKKGNPQCFLYYMTTGKWVEDLNLSIRRDAAIRDIEELGSFRSVGFECLGAEQIQKLYRESQNAISTEIVFSKRVVVPEIEGVEEAYIGVLPSREYLKLVETENGEMYSALFYDNVRHWQDWNPVNNEIRKTLEGGSRRLFPLLNNGITVVAKRVNPTGDKFQIEDYQIVNGCQTSYVLHACREQLDESVYVPVRLIATRDEGVRNEIIKATNRQTEITSEQFFALEEFPKKLENFFPSFDGAKKLYYERRSRQYNGTPGIEKVRVITMKVLVRAFAAIFREIPHRTTRNYKALLREVGKDIFGPNHRIEPYYSAAFAHFRLEYLFRNGHIRTELKPARHHILMAARIIWNPTNLPSMTSNEMARFCEDFNKVLWDDEKSRGLLLQSAKVVEKIAKGNLHRDNVRTDGFTGQLRSHLGKVNRAGRSS